MTIRYATPAAVVISVARCTAYYPANTKLEGGTTDRMGNPLKTLQQYLTGTADYVSVAADSSLPMPFGTNVRIPAIDVYYNKPILFVLCDTGGAFDRQGLTRIDICVDSPAESLRDILNDSHYIFWEVPASQLQDVAKMPGSKIPPKSTECPFVPDC